MDLWTGAMIGNDIGRSLEFVKSPSLAGKQAKELPFSLQIIIAIFVLCAIISVVISNLLGQVIPIDPAELEIPQNSSEFELKIYEMVQLSFEYFRSNPIITVIISAAMGFISSILLYVVGRNFAPSIGLLESQSAFARFELVKTVFISALQGIAILFWMVSHSMGSAISNVIVICGMIFLIIKIYVIRGVFEVEGFGKAFLIWGMSMLCMLGVGFLASLIMTVVIL